MFNLHIKNFAPSISSQMEHKISSILAFCSISPSLSERRTTAIDVDAA